MHKIHIEADTSEAEAAFLAVKAREVWLMAGGLDVDQACNGEDSGNDSGSQWKGER